MEPTAINELTEKIIGAAMKAHSVLGPGFLESVYKAALAYELRRLGIPFAQEAGLPVIYESIVLEVGFRCDFLVDGRVIVECKAVKALTPIDEAQLLNYLKTTHLTVGLIFNFNVLRMKDGIRRMVNNFPD